MEPTRVATVHDVQEALTPFYVKTSQLFYLTLAIGVLLFLLVVLFVRLEQTELVLSASVALVQLLSLTHFLFALAGYIVSFYLFEHLFLRRRLQGAPDFSAKRIVMAVRLARMIRLTIMEGIAFLGLAICLIAAQNGILQQFPEYWLNSLTSLFLIAYVILDFPTRERLEEACCHTALEHGSF